MIDYVLVPDSSSGRRLRRLISADSARMGLVVGTWSELVEMASRAYLINTANSDEWQEILYHEVATIEDAFWSKSFGVAPHEVVQYLDSALHTLLYAASSPKLNFSTEQLSKLNPRATRHLLDLQRLHEQMGGILPTELTAIERIVRVDVKDAGFAICLYRHREIPHLAHQQFVLINKIEADFEPGRDEIVCELLSTLFDVNENTASALGYLQKNLFTNLKIQYLMMKNQKLIFGVGPTLNYSPCSYSILTKRKSAHLRLFTILKIKNLYSLLTH